MKRTAIALVCISLLLGCRGEREHREDGEGATLVEATGGNPRNAQTAMRRYGCGSCHRIPGIPGARGMVAEPLDDFGLRSFIAGEVPNIPENLILWIMNPQAIEPKTAMPYMGVTPQEARDMAAYLYTLR